MSLEERMKMSPEGIALHTQLYLKTLKRYFYERLDTSKDRKDFMKNCSVKQPAPPFTSHRC